MATLPALPSFLHRREVPKATPLLVPRGFTERDARIIRSLSAAAMPQGAFLEGGGEVTLRRLERWLTGLKPVYWTGLCALLWTAELASVPFTGRPLSSLPRERATRFLESWSRQRSA